MTAASEAVEAAAAEVKNAQRALARVALMDGLIATPEDQTAEAPFLRITQCSPSFVRHVPFGEDERVFLTVEIDGEKFLLPLERA